MNCILLAALTMWCIQTPPEHYLSAGQATVDAGIVEFLDLRPRQTSRYCARFFEVPMLKRGERFLGCAIALDNGTYQVVIADDLDGAVRQWTITHEIGHIGGWPRDHEGGGLR